MDSKKRRTLTAAFTAAALVGLVAGAALFQPWRLFTSSSLNEALPVGVQAAPGENPTPAMPVPASPVPASPVPASPLPAPASRVLTTGQFQSQEHTTTGTASLVELPDGTLIVRLENLASSDGPDVKVWLSGLEAGGDWFKYRSGNYMDLGAIKATHGNQNYVVPAGTDLSHLSTVVLWCDRFSVAFGSAALAAAP
ncbi:DM13 domain-containing protein [Pseudarthrobacter sp. N5]|uniref:DM13 domain-containing protein n=1 Tax=Pseudarthrobacter sp. N5 TaxID=3418416 RepID=UPI003CF64439